MLKSLRDDWVLVGGLSEPSKMPCYSYSTPAKYCQIGSKLRDIENSTCSFCYACKGRYNFPHVQNCLEKRFIAMQTNPNWVPAMGRLINGLETSGFFRWFDSGDLQGLADLDRICKVCYLTPEIAHWLPTREYSTVISYFDKNDVPNNLTVRLSSYMVNGRVPKQIMQMFDGLTESSVSSDGFNCPSSKQGNSCLNCRLCWDKETARVVYKKH